MTNRIEIKADGPVEVTVNGEPIESRRTTPDRITITLTEREAELVRYLTGGALPWRSGRYSHAHLKPVCEALTDTAVGFITGYSDVFSGQVVDSQQCNFPGYAHAERVSEIVSFDGSLASAHTETRIRLTMDRDVAVTLAHLMRKLNTLGELLPVYTKLKDCLDPTTDADHIPSRFTGTIRWKKRRLNTFECEEGKTYRLVKRPGKSATAKAHRMEWEEVE